MKLIADTNILLRLVADIVDLLADILDTDKFVTDRPAVEAGLSVLRAGGDFADGVIAYQGFAMGGVALARFDRDAVARVSDCVGPAFIPGSP